MKAIILALALLGASAAASAVEVHGSIGADTAFIGYGVKQNPGKPGSVAGALTADFGHGFAIEGTARQMTLFGAGWKDDLSAAYTTNVAGFGVKTNVGHVRFAGAPTLNYDYNYGKVRVDRDGFYAQEEHRIGTRTSIMDTDFVTLGYAKFVTPKLQLGAEVVERNYRAESKWRFNDVSLYGKYKLTDSVDLLAAVAHGGRTNKDMDIPGVASVGFRYNF